MTINEDFAIINDDSWWRLNPRKHYMYAIEWSAEFRGIVRAKLDSIAGWDYKPCSDVRFAQDVGHRMIDKQKAERINYSPEDGEAEYYYDAYYGA